MPHPVYNLARQIYPEARRIPFQERVYDAISEGHSVILQAPTGSGKTFAALAPFVLGAWGAETGPAAQKMIYSLPLRVLAGSLKADYERDLGAADLRLNFTTQYGGAAHDTFLDGGDAYWTPEYDNVVPGTRHVVFTTIDQTLSAYTGIPASLPYRLANVPCGSVMSGALVFDEFHLLDPDRSFLTALHLLQDSPWPVLVMTATMSRAMRSRLASFLDAEVITVGEDDVAQIQSQSGTVKTLHVRDDLLSGAAVAQNLGERTLVICNRVDRAQQVYDELCEALDAHDDPPKHLLLHSRFLPADRDEKEEKVRAWLRKGSTEHAVVVATQVVEAGLDVSADVQHLEGAPVDSFLQRVGRSARFGETHADIYVYAVPGAAPYDEGRTEATLEALRRHASQEGELRYEHLQSLIDEVLTDSQNEILQSYEAGRRERQHTIDVTRENVDYGNYRSLIRHVDAVEVVVAEPEDLREASTSAFEYDAVSVPRSTFERFLRKEGTQAWVAGTRDVSGDDESEETLQDATGLSVAEWPSRRFIVPPAHAAYTSGRGLRLGEEGAVTFTPNPEPASWTRYRYEREPYALHVQRVLDRVEVRGSVVDAIRRMSASDAFDIDVHDPALVLALMIWAHDVAKLSSGWQGACGGPETPLGHGGRLPGCVPPPHAAESAFMTGNLLGAALTKAGESTDTICCVLKAIRTHHSPGATSLHDVEVPGDYQRYLRETTQDLLGDRASLVLDAWDEMRWGCGELQSPDWPSVPRNTDALYRLLVYALRRSDQLATSLAST